MVISHKKFYLIISLSFLMLFFSLCSTRAETGEETAENNSLVGRIAHIEGQLLRYVPEEEDWVVAVENAPFGDYDVLYSSEDGKAEIIMPNNTLMRIGKETQVQLIELKSELTEVEVSSGSARFYNNSSNTYIKVTTPFGDLDIPPEASCDLYLEDDQVEVVALKGSVNFNKAGTTGSHEVLAESSSLVVTADRVTSASGNVYPKWDRWNTDRDKLWDKRMQSRGTSEKYLPAGLQSEAYALEKHGRWERVYYEGDYRYFWRPLSVSVGWTPFSSGRWTLWHGEQTWIPDEPYGYVTHHYGNWVYARNRWYWGPPVSRVMVSAGLPLLNVDFCWYPGRVGWINSSINIGWFPLAPFEIYYSHRYWGSRSRVRRIGHNYYYDKHRYRHYRHARVLKQGDLYRHNNYRHAGLRKVREYNNYRGAAFAYNKRHYQQSGMNRYKFTNDRLRYKPNRAKIARIKKHGSMRVGKLKYNNRPLKRNINKSIKTTSRGNRQIVTGKNRTGLNNKRSADVRSDQRRKRLSNNDFKKSLDRKRRESVDGDKRKKNKVRYTDSDLGPSGKRAKNRDVSNKSAVKNIRKVENQKPGNLSREKRSVEKARKRALRKGQGTLPKVVKQKSRRNVKTVDTKSARTGKGSTFNVIEQKNTPSVMSGRGLKQDQKRTVRTSQTKIRTSSVSKQNRSGSGSSISRGGGRSSKQNSYNRSITSQNRSGQSRQGREYESRQGRIRQSRQTSPYAGTERYGTTRGRRN